MSRAVQIAPWTLSIVLSLALGGTWFKLNSELRQTKSELAELKGQYAQLSDESAKRQREFEQKYNTLLSEANQKLSEASSKLQEVATVAAQQIELANEPEAQVRVSYRKALLASGSVIKITSTSNEPIAVTAEIHRPSSGKARAFELTLNPNQSKEIGELEGWALIAGDSVKILQANHKSLASTAP